MPKKAAKKVADVLNPSKAGTTGEMAGNWGWLITAVVTLLWTVAAHYGWVSGPAPVITP